MDEAVAARAITDFAQMKRDGTKIVMVTAYDAPSARLAEEAGIDIVFVGDSAANNVLGYPDTTAIGMDEMIMLARAARRTTKRAFFVVDMPLGAFQESDESAVHNAIRFVKEAGAHGVKLEGGGPMVARARAIAAAGIPVMGHLGLTPQTATALGGYKAQGRTGAQARQLFVDALALQRAGCFAIVLEAVPARVAGHISRELSVPTIGIGAGPDCDGQVLVWHDLLGITTGPMPRFVKRYADVAGEIRRGLADFAAEVRNGTFPSAEHTYKISDEEYALFASEVASEAIAGDDWI
jgi:3-methyl-2-oxobutanoate hydroxymethyltransferase